MVTDLTTSISPTIVRSGLETQEMLAMLEKYGDFSEARSFSGPSYVRGHIDDDKGDVVLLTGATGRFRAYLLAQMLVSQRVSKIYTLNGTNEAPLKQR